MKKLNLKSYIKVLKCASDRHTNMTGHILSKRLHGGYNIKLLNHEHCAALKVKMLVRAHKPLKKEKTWIEIFTQSIYWKLTIAGII